MSELAAIGAFRACTHGEGISYATHMEGTADTASLTRLVESLADRGIVDFLYGDEREDHPAILDLKDANGDFVGEAFIKTDEAWATLVRMLELRADSSDCAVCEPAAHAATYG
jgi:hypothetical protein